MKSSEDESLPLDQNSSEGEEGEEGEEAAQQRPTKILDEGQKKLNFAFKKMIGLGDKVVRKIENGLDKVIDKIDGIETNRQNS